MIERGSQNLDRGGMRASPAGFGSAPAGQDDAGDMTERAFENNGWLEVSDRAAQVDTSGLPSISVALCTYNGERYLREQLDSILNQTVLPCEIVISDDGSTDGTLAIIEEFASKSPVPIRFSQTEENLHFSGNFLRAASLCTGDYVAFSDQDDIWHAEKLEVCRKIAAEKNADLVIHRAAVIDASGREIPNEVRPQPANSSLRDRFQREYLQSVLGCCFTVKRTILEEILDVWDWPRYKTFRKKHGFLMGHDLFIFCWCYNRKNIVHLSKLLLKYRVHDGNVSAPNNVGISRTQKFRRIFRTLNSDAERYMKPAQKWHDEADFLTHFFQNSRMETPIGFKLFYGLIQKKSKIWFLRSNIYNKKSSLHDRMKSFMKLVAMGGYTSGYEVYGASFRSLAKDIVFVLIGKKI